MCLNSTWLEEANSALLSQGPNHPFNVSCESNNNNNQNVRLTKVTFLDLKDKHRFSFKKELNLQTSQTPLDFGQESQPEGLRGGRRT